MLMERLRGTFEYEDSLHKVSHGLEKQKPLDLFDT